MIEQLEKINQYNPASLSYIQGPSGGNGGTNFDDSQIASTSGEIIGLWFQWSDNAIRKITTNFSSNVVSHGVDTGTGDKIILQSDQIISVIVYTSNFDTGRVAGVSIQTKNGQSKTFGKATNIKSTFAVPDGYKVIAFCGRAGLDIDALGVVYGKKS
jgi:hypothetical protein